MANYKILSWIVKNLKYVPFIILCLQVSNFLLWPYLWQGSFYQLNGISWFLVFLYIIFGLHEKSKWELIVLFICLALTFNESFDEAFGDPKTLGWNEVVIAILATVLTPYFIVSRHGKK